MTEYRVEITEEALADMEALYSYIAYELLAPENAMNQYDRIADAIMDLVHFPERCRIMDAEPGHSKGLRKLLVDHYIVFYLIRGDSVIVTDVLYSGSDIEQRLR